MDIRIEEAFNEIHRYCPKVNIALFLPDGTWRYFDTAGEMPSFPKEIDTSILEAANDSVDSTPAVYQDDRILYDWEV